MSEMISKSLPEYAGRVLSKGERFHVEAEHVVLLAELGLAERAEPMANGAEPLEQCAAQSKSVAFERLADVVAPASQKRKDAKRKGG